MSERKPTYEELKARVKSLEEHVWRLTELLEKTARAGKRQAAPFSKGPPKADPKSPVVNPARITGLIIDASLCPTICSTKSSTCRCLKPARIAKAISFSNSISVPRSIRLRFLKMQFIVASAFDVGAAKTAARRCEAATNFKPATRQERPV